MNQDNLFGQMNFWRKFVMEVLHETAAETLYVTPPHFSNNLLWHAGHLLVTYDEYLFTIDGEKQLNQQYSMWFATGTSPASWGENRPAIEDILQKLESQASMIEVRFAGRLSEELPKPLPLERTIEELLVFLISHETYHLGVMKSIQKNLKG
ncbi:DinB family protein [Bacillus sp. H-16]|uniref:DinB family protein n=1 Tax=Alteribacter salitolerans TaxID=2912333 RepID=UPI001962BB5C|nr:DinB family protein [Alteribacter salitolerans]MBM7095114.1 DinB family protein [Alteribacter salitolerans]